MPTIERVEPEIFNHPDYLDMDDPLVEGFDWPQFSRVNQELAKSATFLVLFVSQQHEDLSEEDRGLLQTLDEASHTEAQKSEALIKYFGGEVDERGRALSWCLWSDRKAAADALHGPSHKQAIRLAREGRFYKTYRALFYAVSLDEQLGLKFTPMANNHNMGN